MASKPWSPLWMVLGLGLASPSIATAATVTSSADIDSAAWVDHDGRPIATPRNREKPLYGHEFREAIVEPLSHAFDIPDKILWLIDALGGDTEREAVNVNAFDEVANSTWFTNRNHVKSVSLEDVRKGAYEDIHPSPPYTIKSVKRKGVNPGFNIKDAAGKRWVVKFDRPGYPQLGSGADVVSSRLLYAAGYNISHDVTFSFRRDELKIDEDLLKGKEGPPFIESDLESLLVRGHHDAGGRIVGQASLFLPGKPVGPIDMRGRRPDDPNDRFRHFHRRELRGLYVLMSWLNSWDTKDHQSLDTFMETEKPKGYVRHHLLDVGASLGAAAEGPKKPANGYENTIDWAWIARRFFSLGFAAEPWRRARQETGIPTVGNFESEVWQPNQFKPIQPHPAFRLRTERDGYWGAKLVASFSDNQIRAAIDAAGYDDPRARDFLARQLIERRDKTARYWFSQVAPLDFFHVAAGELHFHDLAVDRGLEARRHYEVRLAKSDGKPSARRWNVADPAFTLAHLGDGVRDVELELSAVGLDADPTNVWLIRKGNEWVLTGVRHGH